MLLALMLEERGAAPPELSFACSLFCYRDAAPPELRDDLLIKSELRVFAPGNRSSKKQ